MTAPLTPVDCDLRGMPYMPLHTLQLMDSDLFAISSGDEFKAAVTLWCKAWQQVPAASLPSDERILAALSTAGKNWKKVREVAMRGFVLCDDGRWYHPVIANKAIEAWTHRMQQRGRAAKRWQGKTGEERPKASSHGNAVAYANGHAVEDATAYATAMQVEVNRTNNGVEVYTVDSAVDNSAKPLGAIAPLKSKPAQWWTTEQGVVAMGKTLGISAQRGEDMQTYKSRIFTAKRQQERKPA